ncbi:MULTISPECIES: proteophosphoglycan 5 [Streptomyces]|uniref:Proteophosphoglycan 5 n=2 Tax=Streptomyces clavifer TaxID=68188 RepID=A0ABS4V1Z2_9ACTN|nr:proteophosphoglycan 5 [Streptomyces sp. NRRL_B-2557]MBP2357876.1 hypothetical protein [Streptomyces clavifer]MDX2742451.1 proteophosphoglycan 5 [Streptomyces sp. NRRL_B-2557]
MMGLVQLNLPRPMSLRGRWAALAAVRAAWGRGDDCRAEGSLWHYDDGDGNWADLHHRGDGRAVLLGHSNEDSETFYAEGSDFFEEPETDLLAGAPEWWEPPVRGAREGELFLGFVYGFDGSTWERAEYDAEDGFRGVRLPALSDESTRASILALIEHASGPQGSLPSRESVDALIEADARIDKELLADVVPSTGWDVTAGVAAALAFRPA